MKPKEWIHKILLAIDISVNVLLRGDLYETMSGRAYRMRQKDHKYWGWTADAIDWGAWHIFRDPDHCRRAHRGDIKRLKSALASIEVNA